MSDDLTLTPEDRSWNIRCILNNWGQESAADKRAEREREERHEAYVNAHWGEGMTVRQRFVAALIDDRRVDAKIERERARKQAEAGEWWTAQPESEASRAARLVADGDRIVARARAEVEQRRQLDADRHELGRSQARLRRISRGTVASRADDPVDRARRRLDRVADERAAAARAAATAAVPYWR